MKSKQNPLGFSMIEILIWIFIFSLWFVSIYAIIVSTLNVNTYNKNYIVASNLAREQLELFRNIRDSNYVKIQKYNQRNPNDTNFNKLNIAHSDYDSNFLISTWSYYKIENNFNVTASFPISIEPINNFLEWVWNLKRPEMKSYNLCLDSEKRYVYDCITLWNKETKFFKYIYVSEAKDINGVIKNAIKVKSKVIWYIKWYHEFEINTIIADFKRL